MTENEFCDFLERTRRFSDMISEVDAARLIDFADGHNHPFYYLKSVVKLIGELAGDAIGVSEWWLWKHHSYQGETYKVYTLYLYSHERDTYYTYTLNNAHDVWHFIHEIMPLYTEEEIREGLAK